MGTPNVNELQRVDFFSPWVMLLMLYQKSHYQAQVRLDFLLHYLSVVFHLFIFKNHFIFIFFFIFDRPRA